MSRWNDGRFNIENRKRRSKSGRRGRVSVQSLDAWIAAGNTVTECPPATVGVVQWKASEAHTRKPARLF